MINATPKIKKSDYFQKSTIVPDVDHRGIQLPSKLLKD